MNKIKNVILAILGSLFAFVFSSKALAQSAAFFYGIENPGRIQPVLSPKHFEWWFQLPLKIIIPAVVVLIALVIGLIISIKKRLNKNAEKSTKAGQAEAMGNSQGADPKSS